MAAEGGAIEAEEREGIKKIEKAIVIGEGVDGAMQAIAAEVVTMIGGRGTGTTSRMAMGRLPEMAERAVQPPLPRWRLSKLPEPP